MMCMRGPRVAAWLGARSCSRSICWQKMPKNHSKIAFLSTSSQWRLSKGPFALLQIARKGHGMIVGLLCQALFMSAFGFMRHGAMILTHEAPCSSLITAQQAHHSSCRQISMQLWSVDSLLSGADCQEGTWAGCDAVPPDTAELRNLRGAGQWLRWR